MRLVIAMMLAIIIYQLESIETAITAQTIYMQEGDIHGTTSQNAAHHIAHEAVARVQDAKATGVEASVHLR